MATDVVLDFYVIPTKAGMTAGSALGFFVIPAKAGIHNLDLINPRIAEHQKYQFTLQIIKAYVLPP